MRARALGLLLLGLCFFPAAVAVRAPAQTTASATPTVSPSVSPSNPDVTTNRKVIGFVYLTAFAVAGILLSRWMRRGRPPRPPGPFGSMRR